MEGVGDYTLLFWRALCPWPIALAGRVPQPRHDGCRKRRRIASLAVVRLPSVSFSGRPLYSFSAGVRFYSSTKLSVAIVGSRSVRLKSGAPASSPMPRAVKERRVERREDLHLLRKERQGAKSPATACDRLRSLAIAAIARPRACVGLPGPAGAIARLN